MVSINELMKQIRKLGYPVAYRKFINTEENTTPKPPFIIYIEGGSNNFGADNKVWAKVPSYEIELYTTIREFSLEAEIEKVLDDNNVFYETDIFEIPSENLHEVIYYINLIK